MKKPLVVEPEAGQELEEAAFWYEEQRVGLGQGFLGAAEAVFDQICTYPKSGTSVPYLPEELPAQRVPLQHFPYQVV